MNAMQDREAATRPVQPGLTIGLRTDHPGGRGGSRAQQPAAFKLRGSGQRRLEESTDRPERELALELVATGIEDEHPSDRALLTGGRHKRALAASRGPLHHRQAASAPQSIPDRIVEGAKLRITFQEGHIAFRKT
jgi:hypothetical protein